ncbi:MAG: hypothetical protein ACHQQS_14215 [Thermoanaerobaculales bacterium]
MKTANSVKTALVAATVAGTLLLGASAQAGEIQWRRCRQQQRIAQGVASGQLTARETARLEGQEARLNGEIRAMRVANGGWLTPGERALINRQQNVLSRRIYREKHDGDVRW